MTKIFIGSLSDILNRINNYPVNSVLYLEKSPNWQRDSKGCVVVFEDDEDVPMEFDNMPYFLEINIVLEVIDVWKKNYGKNDDLSNPVIYYAENDAYLWIE